MAHRSLYSWLSSNFGDRVICIVSFVLMIDLLPTLKSYQTRNSAPYVDKYMLTVNIGSAIAIVTVTLIQNDPRGASTDQ